MIPECSTTIILLTILTKDLGGGGKSHNLFNASPSTASLTNEIPPPEKQMPQLVQCKSNNYNCKSHNCKSLHAPQLSFFFYQPKIWEVEVGQRRRGFMLSIQSKNQLKTWLRVGSFLACWLAGLFCRNLLLSTKDLDDETQ